MPLGEWDQSQAIIIAILPKSQRLQSSVRATVAHCRGLTQSGVKNKPWRQFWTFWLISPLFFFFYFFSGPGFLRLVGLLTVRVDRGSLSGRTRLSFGGCCFLGETTATDNSPPTNHPAQLLIPPPHFPPHLISVCQDKEWATSVA